MDYFELSSVSHLAIRDTVYTLRFALLTVKNTRGIEKNAEKEIQAIPAHSRPWHGVMGLQLRPLTPVIVA